MALNDLETQTGPGPALIRHGRRYLEGCLNEEARDAWILAIAQATAGGVALDAALLEICRTYLEHTPRLRATPGMDGECYCNSLRHRTAQHPVDGCLVSGCECRALASEPEARP